jgi:hypothetical protein
MTINKNGKNFELRGPSLKKNEDKYWDFSSLKFVNFKNFGKKTSISTQILDSNIKISPILKIKEINEQPKEQEINDGLKVPIDENTTNSLPELNYRVDL